MQGGKMAAIEREHLLELEDIVFVRRQNTIESVASRFSQADIVETIREARRAIREVLLTLPDAAFDAQPPDDDGEPVWSAGELSCHLLEMMLWLQLALEQLAGNDPGAAPDEQVRIDVLGRSATLATLDRSDHELERALELADEVPEGRRIKINGLGEPGVRGLLLLHAIHEWEHADQFAALDWGD